MVLPPHMLITVSHSDPAQDTTESRLSVGAEVNGLDIDRSRSQADTATARQLQPQPGGENTE